MRIALAGGTGFIGGHVLRAALHAGHDVMALHRPGTLPALQHPRLAWKEGSWGLHPGAWVEEADALVNAVGVLNVRRVEDFVHVHVEGAKAFFSAGSPHAKRVQISALGADAQAPTLFLRTKADADAWLLGHFPQSLVLRPSVVYGPGDFSMAWLARLASLPVVPLPAGGTMRLQPLFVGDVAESMLRALEDKVFPTGLWNLGGPEPMSLRALLQALAAPRPLRILPVPAAVMDLAAHFGSWMGLSLLNRDAWAMLKAGNTCDPAPLAHLLARPATSLQAGLAQRRERSSKPRKS